MIIELILNLSRQDMQTGRNSPPPSLSFAKGRKHPRPDVRSTHRLPCSRGAMLRDYHIKLGGRYPVPSASPSPAARLYDLRWLHGSDRAKKGPDGCERPRVGNSTELLDVTAKRNHQDQTVCVLFHCRSSEQMRPLTPRSWVNITQTPSRVNTFFKAPIISSIFNHLCARKHNVCLSHLSHEAGWAL